MSRIDNLSQEDCRCDFNEIAINSLGVTCSLGTISTAWSLVRPRFAKLLNPLGLFFGRFRPIFRLYLHQRRTCVNASASAGAHKTVRAKTYRQLRDLVHFKLDVGLSFAALVEVEEAGTH